jgi:ribosomal protein S18 acetylase RimI-like enzyme
MKRSNIFFKKKKFNRNDILFCAHTHKENIKNSLLTSLGTFFLYKFYKTAAESKNCFLIILKFNNSNAGFFLGCISISNFYTEFLIKNLILLIRNIFIILNYHNLKKILRHKYFFSKKTKNKKKIGTIINFCIKKNYQGKNFGTILFKEALNFFKKKNINKIKIITGKKQIPANKLYTKFNAKKLQNNDSNLNMKNNIYFLNIN